MDEDKLSKEIGELIIDNILNNALDIIAQKRKRYHKSFEYRAMLARANEIEDSRQKLIYPELKNYRE